MSDILFERTQLVPLTSLKTYDKNPRKGNVKAIAESLKTNKQYRPIVVQKKSKKILAGNHTFKAAKELGWKEIAVVMVDVDDQEAARIVLADNRTNDLAEYDNTVLAELLGGLPEAAMGTGYSQDDIDLITSTVSSIAGEATTLTGLAIGDAMDAIRGTAIGPADLDDGLDADTGLATDSTTDTFESAQAELQGVLQLSDEAYFEMGLNPYDIPKIRKDMLVEALPEPLDTWGGPEASTDDGETTYIWNYGLASPTGLPFDRAILCFYTYDFKFEGWWEKPSYYTAKVINRGITMAITPDFSVWWDDPKTFQIYSIYRAQWFARYFQEAGVRVIPRAIMADTEAILSISWMGIPREAPVVSMSMQTMDKNSEKEMKAAATSLKANCDELKPEKMLVYGGNPAKGVCEKVNPLVDTEIIWVRNYAAVRRGVAFGNLDGIEGEKARKRAEKIDTDKAKKHRPGGLT